MMAQRTKIIVGDKNYIYADQIKFFLNRKRSEKTKEDLNYYVEMWAMYNAVNDLWEKDPSVAELRWDHKEGIAVFVFPKVGEVMSHLNKKGFNIDE